MTDYLIDDADLQSGTLIKRAVDSSWLHAGLLAAAERLQNGTADNLDLHDASANPTGCFLHPDVQQVFYDLHGIPRGLAEVAAKRAAVQSAAELLQQRYA